MRRTKGKPGKPDNSELHPSTCLARRSRFTLAAFGAGVAALLLGGAVIVRTAAAPQSETTTTEAQTAQVKPDAPGTIDGAKNPELIPDEVALRMIVQAIAEPPDATEEQIERARAKLTPIGLSEEDTVTLLSLLGEFHAQADAVDKDAAEVYVRAPFPHPNSADYKRLIELGNQQTQLASSAVSALPARLSSEGFKKLLLYIPEAKKGMKMTNESLMSK